MRWHTSKGDVSPVFTDTDNGYSYKLKAFRNVNTNDNYRLEDIQHEIKPSNRIGTLEQITESFDILEEAIEKQQIQYKNIR